MGWDPTFPALQSCRELIASMRKSNLIAHPFPYFFQFGLKQNGMFLKTTCRLAHKFSQCGFLSIASENITISVASVSPHIYPCTTLEQVLNLAIASKFRVIDASN